MNKEKYCNTKASIFTCIFRVQYVCVKQINIYVFERQQMTKTQKSKKRNKKAYI